MPQKLLEMPRSKTPLPAAAVGHWLVGLRIEKHVRVPQADAPFHAPARPQRCLAAGVVQIAQVHIEMAAQRGGRVGACRSSRPALCRSPRPTETGRQRPLRQSPTAADSPIQIAAKRSSRAAPSAPLPRRWWLVPGTATVICPAGSVVPALDHGASDDAQLHVEEPPGLRQPGGIEQRVFLEIGAFQFRTAVHRPRGGRLQQRCRLVRRPRQSGQRIGFRRAGRLQAGRRRAPARRTAMRRSQRPPQQNARQTDHSGFLILPDSPVMHGPLDGCTGSGSR